MGRSRIGGNQIITARHLIEQAANGGKSINGPHGGRQLAFQGAAVKLTLPLMAIEAKGDLGPVLQGLDNGQGRGHRQGPQR